MTYPRQDRYRAQPLRERLWLHSHESLRRLEQYRPLRNWREQLRLECQIEAMTHPDLIAEWKGYE